MKNMMHTWIAACASALTLTAMSSYAGQDAAAAGSDRYTGMVVAVNPNEHTLDVKGLWMTKTFNLGDDCSYVQLDKPAGTMSDLRSGEKVTVTYVDAHGVRVANRVQQIAMTHEGTVKAIDPMAKTVTLHEGMTGDKTYRLPADCRVVLRNDHTGTLDAVKPGNYVTITYETPGGKAVARQIAQTSDTFVGEVTAIDLTDRTVKAKALFGSKKFSLGDNCTIILNGKMNAPLNDVRLGERLEFSYDDVNGINVANRIATAPAESETTSSSMPVP